MSMELDSVRTKADRRKTMNLLAVLDSNQSASFAQLHKQAEEFSRDRLLSLPSSTEIFRNAFVPLSIHLYTSTQLLKDRQSFRSTA